MVTRVDDMTTTNILEIETDQDLDLAPAIVGGHQDMVQVPLPAVHKNSTAARWVPSYTPSIGI